MLAAMRIHPPTAIVPRRLTERPSRHPHAATRSTSARLGSARLGSARLALSLLLAAVPLSAASCAPRAPIHRQAPLAVAPATAAASAAQPTAQNLARLQKIRKTNGKALCKLAGTADPARDAVILGDVLELAHTRRRSEADRTCYFELLVAMHANEMLPVVAAAATTTPRWLAILAWAGRNLRAKHFDVYLLALRRPEALIRLSAVTQLGRHSAGPGALKVLEVALADALTVVRIKAVQAAADMDHPAVGKYLRNRQKIETDKAVLAAINRVLSR